MIIYLIRHGRQNSSNCNVNVPLAKEGRRQAALLGERMLGYPIDALYCSDLIRAEETARIAFANRPELLQNLQIRTGLAEISFGSLTGAPDAKVKEFYADYYEMQQQLFGDRQKAGESVLPGHLVAGSVDTLQVDAFVGQFFVPPEEMQYPDGENGAAVLNRLMPVVQEWIDSGKTHIAVVCHGGVIRVLLCALFGGDFARRLQFGTTLENCSITQIHFDEKLQGFFLDRFNDAAHLEGYPELMRGVWKG